MKDYGDPFEGFRQKCMYVSEPLKKAIGVAIWQSRRQKVSSFSACKAEANQHEIRIVFFACNN